MKLIVACAVSTLALLSSGAASSAVIYQTGFEQPDFQLGPIDGQNNWIWEGTIEAGVTHSGDQALHIDNQANSYQTPTYTFSAPATGIYTITASYLRTGNNPEFGGMSVIGDTGFIAQIQSNGSGQYYLGNTNRATVKKPFSPTAWHDLRLVLNFNTYQMAGYVDGVRLGKLAINNVVAPSSLTQVRFVAYNHRANTVHEAYIDDLRIAAVPEPATWAMMLVGFGGIGYGMRSRRKVAVSFG